MPELEMKEAPSNMEPIEDDSVFDAEIISIAERERETKDGEKYKQLNWRFVIVDDEVYDGKNVWGDTSLAFHDLPECKLRNWAMAILGGDIPIGWKGNTDEFVGTRVRIAVGAREYEKDGVEKVYNFVREVLPDRVPGAPAKAASEDDYGEEPF